MLINKLKTPNTYAIIFLLTILIAILTWIIPTGEYERITKDNRELVKNGSYHYVESNPQGIDAVLMAPIRGFVDASLIIGFVMIVGGAFGVFQKTEAVDSGIMAIAEAHKKYEFLRKLLIPILMTIFALAGALFGMSEELIPFILVFVPMSLVLGYDSITGVAIPFVGAGVGFAGAFLNPFTVGIAQGIAELPIFSGMEYRIIAWFVLVFTSIIFVTKYANKVKNNPALSLTYEHDTEKKKSLKIGEAVSYNGIDKKHKAVLLTFLAGLLVVVFGVLEYSWFIEEICAVFLLTGIAVGIIGRLTIKEITDSFLKGAKDLIGTAFVIALARGILVIASDGKIIDSILYALSSGISELHPVVSGQAMFIVQTLINFFVPSGSGQAALTMPVMAPLSDLVGVSRQTAVLAFQFGDGFSNMIIPTSAVTMGVLTLAEIPWEKWARWILPLQLILFIIGLILLVPPFFMGW
ncbi:MAG: putative basic amino acid antiporter YfcC [Melioribacteraceae bacterium]|nr:putative basic amino acid antiporter YfcC [Melioribacteraceae bacterium]